MKRKIIATLPQNNFHQQCQTLFAKSYRPFISTLRKHHQHRVHSLSLTIRKEFLSFCKAVCDQIRKNGRLVNVASTGAQLVYYLLLKFSSEHSSRFFSKREEVLSLSENQYTVAPHMIWQEFRKKSMKTFSRKIRIKNDQNGNFH